MEKRRLRLKMSITITAACLLCLGIVFLTTKSVSAASVATLVTKSRLYGMASCFNSDKVFETTVSSDKWNGSSTLFNATNYTFVWVYNNSNDFSQQQCYPGLTEAYNNIIPGKGASISDLNTFFGNLGYSQTTIQEGGKPCATFNFTNPQNGSSAVVMCAETSNGTPDGAITRDWIGVGKIEVIYRESSSAQRPMEIQPHSYNAEITLDCNTGVSASIQNLSAFNGILDYSSAFDAGGCSKVDYSAEGTTLRNVAEAIQLQIIEGTAHQDGGMGVHKWRLVGETPVTYGTDSSDEHQEYSIGSDINKVVATFSNNSYRDLKSLALTPEEKIAVLEYALEHHYGKLYYYDSSEKACNLSESEKSTAIAAGYIELHEGLNICYVKAKVTNKDIRAYNDDGYLDGTKFDFAKIVSQLNTLRDDTYGDEYQKVKDECNAKYGEQASNLLAYAHGIIQQNRHYPDLVDATTLANARNVIDTINRMGGEYWETTDSGGIQCVVLPTLDGGTTERDPNDPTFNVPTEELEGITTSEGSDLKACLNNTPSLGWILCTATLFMGEAAGGAYNSIEDFLVFDAGLLSQTGEDNGIYVGWSYFRDFANTLFAIALVIIILSQVTGIGVTNYGIKKTLPTLIMVAVLVNLSFIMCQILVDASNIVGSTLNTFFDGIEVPNAADISLSSLGANIAGTLGTGVGVIAGVSIVINSWPSIMPILLLALLAALISGIFFYLLLALRQALIAILIAIAPIAIVCYALPNTKKAFSKWWSIFSALLVLYPICGALMGGMKFASRLLVRAGSDNFFYSLVVMLLQIVPVFFIPTLLRNSMTALGNLGAKVTLAGRRLSSGATRAVRSTDGFKTMQNRMLEKGTLQRIRRLENGRGIRNRLAGGLERLGFSRASDALSESAEKSRNRLTDRQRRLALDDINSNIHRDTLTGDLRESAINAERYKQEMGMIQDAENAYITNSEFNHNDVDVLGDEFDQVMNDLTLDSSNALLQAKARALTHMLMGKGPKGQDRLFRTMKGRSYAQGVINGTKDAAGSTVMNYLANDDKMNRMVKEGNYGDWKYMNDYTTDNKTLENRIKYETMGADNISAANLTKAGDDYYLNLLRHAGVKLDGKGRIERDPVTGDIKFDLAKSQFYGNGREGELFKIAKEAHTALTDPRIANNVKGDVKDWLEGIVDVNNQIAYRQGDNSHLI